MKSEMSARERVEEQTRIRKALLANGYTPLANVSKKCMLKNWPRLVVDEAVIDDWSDRLGLLATGVRIEGNLVALDFDIDDAEALDSVWDALPDDLWALVQGMPVRRGAGEKVCLFCRSAGKTPVENIWSKAFYPPGVDVNAGEKPHRLEIFGAGGGGRQIGVYGAHTVEAGEVTVEYAWEGARGLADVALDDLPEVTVRDLERLADVVSEVLVEMGWVYEVRALDGRVQATRAYVLTGGETFDVHGGADGVGLEALEEMAAGADGVRVSMSWREGPAAANRTRGLVSINPVDGRVQIWDSMTGVLYRPAAVDTATKIRDLGNRLLGRSAPADQGGGGAEAAGAAETGGGLSPLDRLLAAVPVDRRLFGGDAESGGDTTPEDAAEESGETAFDAAMDALLTGWAWVTIGAGFAAPVGGSADQMMTLGGLKNTMAPWCKVERVGRKVIETNPADIWIKHPQRIMAVGHKLIPWTEEKIAADETGQTWLNTYQPPRHGGAIQDEVEARRAVAAWVRFLEHLVPDPREREWFEMWLAAKVQKPWLPNCGVVMVAETHGTGRGTLFDMLGAIMGERHVKPVSSTELMGGSGQGQYTDWLADALVVTCDELLAGNDAGGAMEWKRREVYERLKTYVDPRARRVRIVRKGLPGYETEVYASFLMATNNPNALPLAEQDRRFAVVRNTSVKLADADDGAVHADVTAWRGEDSRFVDAFGAAVWQRLAGIVVDFACLRDAPEWMEGRADMLAANEGDLEEIVSNVLGDVPGDFLLGEHLRARLRLALEAGGMEHEMKNWWIRAQDMLARRNGSGWRRMARRQDAQPRGAGRKFVSVYYRVDGAGEAAWEAASLEERAGLWRRGADLNDKLSRIESKVRERGLKVVDGKEGGGPA